MLGDALVVLPVMHICFLNMPIEYYSPISGGAVATVMMQTARGLERRGHRVTVLTPIDEFPTYPFGTVIPIEIKQRRDLSFPARRWSAGMGRWRGWDWPHYGYYRRSFLRALQAMNPKPDVVCVFNDLVSQKYVKEICPRAHRLVWLHNECLTRHADSAAAFGAIDGFVACSGFIGKWAHETYGIPEYKIAVALNGVDLEQFTPGNRSSRSDGSLKVLFLGRIDRNKGPDIAVDAVANLREQGVAIEITVAGGLWFYRRGNEESDPFFQSLMARMKRAGADYVGPVAREAAPELLRAHDVVCVLSRSNEPFGLVVLEAMACGCAVIASNRGGLPEACCNAAILVDPDDPAAVMESLRRFAADRDLLRQYQKRSIARAQHASWDTTVDRFESSFGSNMLNALAGNRA